MNKGSAILLAGALAALVAGVVGAFRNGTRGADAALGAPSGAPSAQDRDPAALLVAPLPVAEPNRPAEGEEAAGETEGGAKGERRPVDGANEDGSGSGRPYPPPPSRPAKPGQVAGWVEDVSGKPERAKIAIVSRGGSHSFTMNEPGPFEVAKHGNAAFVVKAQTADGRIGFFASRGGDPQEGTGDVLLVLRPGVNVTLSLAGARDSLRAALSTDGVLTDDFTLRNGRPAKVVVPPGTLHVQLYGHVEGQRRVFEDRFLHVRAGYTVELPFEIDA